MLHDQPSHDSAPLTELLHRAAAGHRSAADLALPLVYRELRRLAASHMGRERRDHTLQATALVHEVWLKVVGPTKAPWSDRRAFYHAAAAAMRRILIDHARRQRRRKRGGDRSFTFEPLDNVASKCADAWEADRLLQLDEELERLAAQDPRAATVVRLRFFGGLEIAEVAKLLDLSERTVQREWEFARAHLLAAMSDPDDDARA
ncbi:MAG: ECF-type sigma factor [Planctomycetota bacterium]